VAPGAAVSLLATVLTWKSSLLGGSIRSLHHLEWGWLAAAVGLEGLSMATFVRLRLWVLRSAGFPISLGSMIATTYAGNAISMSLPVAGSGIGTAFTYRQLSRRGVPREVAAWALTLTGVVSTVMFALIVSSGAVVSGDRAVEVAGITCGLATLIPVLAVMAALRNDRSRDRLVACVTWLVGRIARHSSRVPPIDRSEVAAAVARLESLRLGRGSRIVTGLLAGANWMLDIACLGCSIKSVGLGVPWPALILAWAAGAGAASFNLTPGGLGVVEAAVAGALVSVHLSVTHAMASVLVYRLVSFWLAAAVGWCAYLLIRRARNAGGDRTALSNKRPAPGRRSCVSANG
jgi:uncharacterized protein (TIRG00374 family)